MNRIDPASAALYSIIAVCFVLLGAVLTPGTLTVEQRGPVVAGLISVLGLVAWRWRPRGPSGGNEGD